MRHSLEIAEIEKFLVKVSEKTSWIFVAVHLAEGITGFGEATRYGLERTVLDVLAEAGALARRKLSPGDILATLRRGRPSAARQSAICGLEMAFQDAMAKRAGISLADMLGGSAQRPVPVYANINRGLAHRGPEGFADKAREILSGGDYRRLKIAPFDDLDWSRDAACGARGLFEAGIERILAVAEVLPEGAELYVDCHGRLSPIMARQLIQRLSDTCVAWIEDPLADTAFDASTARSLRMMANDRGIRIAGGEKLTSLSGARDLLAQGRYDVLLPDLCWSGIKCALTILELAFESGVEGSLHNPAGPIQDLTSLQVAAAAQGFFVLERQVGETTMHGEIQNSDIAVHGSCALLNNTAGIGQPDLTAMRRYNTERETIHVQSHPHA